MGKICKIRKYEVIRKISNWIKKNIFGIFFFEIKNRVIGWRWTWSSNVEEHGQDEISVEEIEKIVVVDIRFGNMDRNKGNLLVREGKNGSLQLVPIDHELSFSNHAQISLWIRWLDYDNGIVNTNFSLRSANYMARLNPDDDLKFLRHCRWEPESIYIEKLKVFATFLKKVVFQKLTTLQIGWLHISVKKQCSTCKLWLTVLQIG